MNGDMVVFTCAKHDAPIDAGEHGINAFPYIILVALLAVVNLLHA